tara:strand:- start:97 stop:762 length:666 start_codon:yes stop_codon:yes gene_type:complete
MITRPYAYKKLRSKLEAMEPDIVGQRLDKYKLVSLIADVLDILRIEVNFENTPNVSVDEINMNAGYSQGIDKWKDPDIYPTSLTLLLNNKQRTYNFSKEGFDELVNRISDAIGHERIHQGQARKRKLQHPGSEYTGPGKDKEERGYLGKPDEVEAFSYNIASELLRRHDKETIINAFRQGDLSILKDSINFVAYLASFEDTDNKTMRNLINKIIKYIEHLN